MKKLGLLILTVAALNVASAQNGFNKKESKVGLNLKNASSIENKKESKTSLKMDDAQHYFDCCIAFNSTNGPDSTDSKSMASVDEYDSVKNSQPQIDSVDLSEVESILLNFFEDIWE